jgi:hypothetical protein
MQGKRDEGGGCSKTGATRTEGGRSAEACALRERANGKTYAARRDVAAEASCKTCDPGGQDVATRITSAASSQ